MHKYFQMDIFQMGLGLLQGNRIGKIEGELGEIEGELGEIEGELGEIEKQVEEAEDKYIFELYTIL